MSKNDQNTCLETPDTTPMQGLRYSSLSEDIPSLLALSVCKIRSRRVWVMVECRGSRVIGRGSRVIGRGSKVEVEGQKSRSRVKSRGRGSKVEGQKSRSRVKSRGSKVKNTKFLSILKVLQPLNAAKQLVLLSKLKNFAYGYAVWLCTV